MKLNAELSPEEISLKRQLRNLIIEIQKAIAKIKMIEFRNGSLWDCRVYKNPLKEIVIDIKEDKTDVEKLTARDKKRSRDKHKLASTLSYGIRGILLKVKRHCPTRIRIHGAAA